MLLGGRCLGWIACLKHASCLRTRRQSRKKRNEYNFGRTQHTGWSVVDRQQRLECTHICKLLVCSRRGTRTSVFTDKIEIVLTRVCLLYDAGKRITDVASNIEC